MLRPGRLTLLVGIALSLSNGACRRPAPRRRTCPEDRLVVGSIQLDIYPTQDAALLDRRRVFDLVKRVLRREPNILLEPSSPCRKAALDVELAFQRTPRPEGRSTFLVRIGLDFKWPEGPPWSYRAASERILSNKDIPGAFVSVLERGLTDLLREPVTRKRLEAASARQVRAALLSGHMDASHADTLNSGGLSVPVLAEGSAVAHSGLLVSLVPLLTAMMDLTGPPLTDEERDIRDMAVETAGRRKLKAAVPVLTKLLRLVQGAPRRALLLDALVDIGDPSAVPAMIAAAHLEDPDELGPILEALAQIGGTRAEQFLQFVADGHPDERIRDIARSALIRIREQRSNRESLHGATPDVR